MRTFLLPVLFAFGLSTTSFAGGFVIPRDAKVCSFETTISYWTTDNSLVTDYTCDGSALMTANDILQSSDRDAITVKRVSTYILSQFVQEGFEVFSLSPNVYDKSPFSSYGKEFTFSGIVVRKKNK